MKHGTRAEIQMRLNRLAAGLEEIRRMEGLWTTGEDGKPTWLPSDDGSPPTIQPALPPKEPDEGRP